MQRIVRTSLGIAAYLAMTFAHSASPSTGGHVLASQLATPGSGGVSAIARPISPVAELNQRVASVGALKGLGHDGRGVNSLVVAAPISEPRTYTLMLAGLGVLGFLARRRKAGRG